MAKVEQEFTVDRQKILSIGVRLTDNLGDVAIAQMIHHLFSSAGYYVKTIDFNFRAVVSHACPSFYHLFRKGSVGQKVRRRKVFSHLENRYLKIVLNFLKLVIYLPIVFVEFIRQSKGCSRVFIGGGNLLMGIEYGFPLQTLTYVLLSRMLGKRVSFVCVGAGPFTASGVKPILRLALRLADRVICRDTQSKKMIENELGARLVVLEVLPDPVLAWPRVDDTAMIKYDILLTGMPLFSPAIFPDGDEGKAHRFKACLEELILSLIQLGKRVGVLVTDPGVDLAFSKDVAEEAFEKTNVRLDINVPATPDEMAAIISSASLVFSTRMHGAIMALSQSVPALGVCWQPKVRGLYTDLQIVSLLVEIDEYGRFPIQDVLHMISDISKNSKSYIEDIDEKVNALRMQYKTRWASL